jgi:glucan 1,3-beta-glucosidase
LYDSCQTAINQLWDWGWAYMGLSINNCGVGLNMSAGGSKNQAVGSVIVIDSHVSNTPIAFTHDRTSTSSPKTGGSLVLENVLLSNVPIAVQEPAAHLDGNRLITSFVSGHAYDSKGPSVLANATLPFSRPGTLVDQSKNYYTRSKPQYQNIPTSQFASVRDAGARGDGRNDDTAALQNIINSATAAGKIVFFDTGMYKVMRTLRIPPGAKIVGEAYPVIFGSGTFFQNTNEPVPVVQVGAAGENGIVEWSDMVVSTQGPCAGAILIQWNLASPANTPSGMWDVHTRIGGFAGSDLQIDQCPTTAQQPQQKCIAAFQSMEVAITANGLYMENVWLWSADHDIEEPKNSQITVYSGRGLSIESQVGNIWL